MHWPVDPRPATPGTSSTINIFHPSIFQPFPVKGHGQLKAIPACIEEREENTLDRWISHLFSGLIPPGASASHSGCRVATGADHSHSSQCLWSHQTHHSTIQKRPTPRSSSLLRFAKSMCQVYRERERKWEREWQWQSELERGWREWTVVTRKAVAWEDLNVIFW